MDRGKDDIFRKINSVKEGKIDLKNAIPLRMKRHLAFGGTGQIDIFACETTAQSECCILFVEGAGFEIHHVDMFLANL
jgi:hypothetical protein